MKMIKIVALDAEMKIIITKILILCADKKVMIMNFTHQTHYTSYPWDYLFNIPFKYNINLKMLYRKSL